MAGFEFAYTLHGNAPRVITVPVKDAGDHSGGILGNLESGEVDIAATTDTALLGLILAPEDPSHNLADLADTSNIRIIADKDAVYAVTDANARVIGATLDIASGGTGVTTSSNVDLVVVATSSSTEKTLVKIVDSQHAYTVS